MNPTTIYLIVLLIAQVSAQLTPEECLDDPYSELLGYANCGYDPCEEILPDSVGGSVEDYCPRSCNNPECDGVPSPFAGVCIDTEQYDLSCDAFVMMGLQMMNQGAVVLTIDVAELMQSCGPNGDIMMIFTSNGVSGLSQCCLDTFDICAVDCPPNSAGTVPGTSGTGGTSDCIVDAGYSGSVTWTNTDPWYTETITAVECPANSAGTVPGTSGTGGTSGCIVDAGFSGSVTVTNTDPWYTETITAVECPANSVGTVPGTSGTGGTSGCIVDAGYSGSVTATTTDPFYTETITPLDASAASSAALPVATLAVAVALFI